MTTIATCPSCAARFRLSDEQTRGRPFVKLRCSRCSTVFETPVADAAPNQAFDGPAPRTLAGIPAIPGPDAPPAAPGALPSARGLPRAEESLPAGSPVVPSLPPRTMGLPTADSMPAVRRPVLPPSNTAPSASESLPPDNRNPFDDFFGGPPPQAGSAATALPSIPAPPAPPTTRSALDELASMDSAAPFMQDLDRGRNAPGLGDLFGAPAGPVGGATMTAPAPSRTSVLANEPTMAAARSPLDDFSGFANLNAGSPPRNDMPPAPLRRSPLDDLSGMHMVTPPSDAASPTRIPADALGATAAMPGATRGPQPDDSLPPFGGKESIAGAGKKTFYPMLEFQKEFGGLDDGSISGLGGEASPRPVGGAPVAPEPRPAPTGGPRTAALSMPSSLLDPIVGTASGGRSAGPDIRAGARAERDEADDRELVELANRTRASQPRQLSEEEIDRIRFDVVGDKAVRSEPRVPFHQAATASALVLCCVAIAAVGYVSALNDGRFEFGDLGRMWQIAVQGAGVPARADGGGALAGPVAGEGIIDPRAAIAGEIVRLSDISAGRVDGPPGGRLAVVEGTISNVSGAPLRQILVEVRLVDASGRDVTAAVVPAGAVLEPAELSAIRTQEEASAALTALGARTGSFELPGGQSTRFSAVFVPQPGLDLAGLTPVVRPITVQQVSESVCWSSLQLGPPSEARFVAADGSGAAQDGSGAEDGSGADDGSGDRPAPDGSLAGTPVPADGSAADGSGETPR